MALPLCQAQTARDGASSHKISHVAEVRAFKEYINHTIGLKVMAILLNGWILPIGGVALERVCDQQGYPFFIL